VADAVKPDGGGAPIAGNVFPACAIHFAKNVEYQLQLLVSVRNVEKIRLLIV
jgi:hypothetical protein